MTHNDLDRLAIALQGWTIGENQACLNAEGRHTGYIYFGGNGRHWYRPSTNRSQSADLLQKAAFQAGRQYLISCSLEPEPVIENGWLFICVDVEI